MKKRVLSALLVLCLACGLVSTAWAADGQATPETAARVCDRRRQRRDRRIST